MTYTWVEINKTKTVQLAIIFQKSSWVPSDQIKMLESRKMPLLLPLKKPSALLVKVRFRIGFLNLSISIEILKSFEQSSSTEKIHHFIVFSIKRDFLSNTQEAQSSSVLGCTAKTTWNPLQVSLIFFWIFLCLTCVLDISNLCTCNRIIGIPSDFTSIYLTISGTSGAPVTITTNPSSPGKAVITSAYSVRREGGLFA